MQGLPLLNRSKLHSNFDVRAIYKISLVFLLLIIFAAVLSKGVFLQPSNLLNLTYQNAILALVSLAQLLIIITGGIDLSVGAIVAISSVMIVLNQDLGLVGSLGVALGASMLFGLISGSLVTFMRLPSFVVTLAMMQIVYSVAKVLSGGGAVYTSPDGVEIAPVLTNFYTADILGIPSPIVLCTLALIGVGLFLRTSLGHFAYPVGGNERAAFLSGIPVRTVKVSIYVLAGLLAGIGGVLFVGRVGMGDPQAGTWLPLDSIAAVSIGGASLAGGTGTVIGTLIGVFILSVLSNILNLLNVPPTFQPAVKGLLILLAVYMNSTKKQT